MNEYRFHINSEKLNKSSKRTSHDLNIYLDREYSNCVDLKVVNISLCNSFYNIKNENLYRIVMIHNRTPGVEKWTYIYLTPGLYNLKEVQDEINYQSGLKRSELPKFKLLLLKDKKNKSVKFVLRNPKAYSIMFKKPIADLFGVNHEIMVFNGKETTPKLIPFTHFNVHCNLVDSSKNIEVSGDTVIYSNLLCSLPIKNVKEFGTEINYNLAQCDYKPCIPKFNTISLSIRDHNGELIDLNGFPVTYEIVVRMKSCKINECNCRT